MKMLSVALPGLSDDPELLLSLAQRPGDDTDVIEDAVRSMSFASIESWAERLDGMPKAQQRARWAQMTEAQQDRLGQTGYKPPSDTDDDDKPFWRDALDEVGEVVAAPVSVVTDVVKGVGKPLLHALDVVGDQPAHLYRTLRMAHEGDGLGGLLAGVATVASGPGMALRFALDEDLREHWMETGNGERAFLQGSRDKALKALKGDRRALQVAELLAGGSTLEEIAAAEGGAYTEAFRQTHELTQTTEFQRALVTLQNGKVSVGRDLARSAGLDPTEGAGRLVSGSIDAAAIVFGDPTLIAGKLAKLNRLRRLGLARHAPNISRIDDVYAADAATRRAFEVMARHLRAGTYDEMARELPSSMGFMNELLDWSRGRQVSSGEDVLGFFKHGEGLAALAAGRVGTYTSDLVTLPRLTRAEQASRSVINVSRRAIDWTAEAPLRLAQGESDEAVEKLLAGTRVVPALAKVAQAFTTQAPRTAGLWTLDNPATAAELSRVVDIGIAGKLTRAQRAAWFNAVMDADGPAGRITQMHNFLDDLFTKAGFMADPTLRAYAQRFTRATDQMYDSAGRSVLDGVPVGLLPVADAATQIAVPSFKEFLAQTRRMNWVRQTQGMVNHEMVDAFMGQVWKPAVLIRIGFIPRAAGEELLSFLFRYSPSRYVKTGLLRAAALDDQTLDDAIRIQLGVGLDDDAEEVGRALSRVRETDPDLSRNAYLGQLLKRKEGDNLLTHARWADRIADAVIGLADIATMRQMPWATSWADAAAHQALQSYSLAARGFLARHLDPEQVAIVRELYLHPTAMRTFTRSISAGSRGLFGRDENLDPDEYHVLVGNDPEDLRRTPVQRSGSRFRDVALGDPDQGMFFYLGLHNGQTHYLVDDTVVGPAVSEVAVRFMPPRVRDSLTDAIDSPMDVFTLDELAQMDGEMLVTGMAGKLVADFRAIARSIDDERKLHHITKALEDDDFEALLTSLDIGERTGFLTAAQRARLGRLTEVTPEARSFVAAQMRLARQRGESILDDLDATRQYADAFGGPPVPPGWTDYITNPDDFMRELRRSIRDALLDPRNAKHVRQMQWARRGLRSNVPVVRPLGEGHARLFVPLVDRRLAEEMLAAANDPETFLALIGRQGDPAVKAMLATMRAKADDLRVLLDSTVDELVPVSFAAEADHAEALRLAKEFGRAFGVEDHLVGMGYLDVTDEAIRKSTWGEHTRHGVRKVKEVERPLYDIDLHKMGGIERIDLDYLRVVDGTAGAGITFEEAIEEATDTMVERFYQLFGSKWTRDGGQLTDTVSASPHVLSDEALAAGDPAAVVDDIAVTRDAERSALPDAFGDTLPAMSTVEIVGGTENVLGAALYPMATDVLTGGRNADLRHLLQQGDELPSVVNMPEYRIRPEPNLYARFVQWSFQGIGRHIDAIIRMPLFTNAWINAYTDAKAMSAWLRDPDLWDGVGVDDVVTVERARAPHGFIQGWDAGQEHGLYDEFEAMLDELDPIDAADFRRRVDALNQEALDWGAGGGFDPEDLSRRVNLQNTDPDAYGEEAMNRLANPDGPGTHMWADHERRTQEIVYDAMDAWRARGLTERATETVTRRGELVELAERIGARDAESMVRAFESLGDTFSDVEAQELIAAIVNKARTVDIPDDMVAAFENLQPTDVHALRMGVENLRHVDEQARNLALERAVNDAVPFIDDHTFRSQYADWMRNVVPFHYADENFLKRWARTFKHSPEALRRGQLIYAGIKHGGFVKQNDQGEDVFVYPGGQALASALTGIGETIGIDISVPVATALTGQVRYTTPGFDQMGTPSIGPLFAIPLGYVTNMFPELRPLEEKLTGGRGSRGLIRGIVPTHLMRFWDAFTATPESDEQFASAMVQAMAYIEANGGSPPPDATATEVEKYLDKVRNHTRVIVLTRAIIGFMGPAAPQVSLADQEAGGIGRLTGLGVDPSQVIRSDFLQLLRALPIEEAVARFLDEHGEDATPFTVFGSEKGSGAPLPATEAAYEFISTHENWMGQFPAAGPWFIPPAVEGQGYDPNAYYDQLARGLRQRKDPEQYYRDLKFQQAARDYFDTAEAKDRMLEDAGTTAERARIRASWNAWKAGYIAQHPIFGEELESPEGRQRRARVLDEMRLALRDPGRPEGPHIERLADLIDTYDAYLAMVSPLTGNRTKVAQDRKRQLEAAFTEWGQAFAIEHPEVAVFWRAVIVPTAGLDIDDAEGMAA